MPGKRRTDSPHKSGPHAKKGQHVLRKLLHSNGVLARAAALADSAEPVAAGNAAVEAACGQDGAPVPGLATPVAAGNDAESISCVSLDLLPPCSQAMVPISPSAEIVRQE